MASVERIPAGRCRRGARHVKGRQSGQGKAAKSLAHRLEPVWLAARGQLRRALVFGLVIAPYFVASPAAFAQTVREAPLPRVDVSSLSLTPLRQDDSASQSNGVPERLPPPGMIQDVPPPQQRSPSLEGLQGAGLYNSVPRADGNDPAETAESAEYLSLADVIASVYRSYPLIQSARQERARAGGELLGAYGAYDTKVQGYSLSEPSGFYRNFRNGLGVARQTWWGGYLSAGYRVGRGDIQPWYQERVTNDGGEFKLAMAQPLLQGRAIDPARVAVFQASLAGRAADPQVQQAILESSHEAAMLYWQWVAAGAMLETQRELLALSVERGQQFEADYRATRRAEVDVIFNNQLIAERMSKKLESEVKFQATAYKLSLFLRDENGQPMVPGDEWLPRHFPEIRQLPPVDLQADLASALQRRPEPMLLRLELRSVQLDRQLAFNDMFPRLDVIAEASQDVGAPSSSKNDKGQFELMVGIQGEVPVQRRKARGKMQTTSAKMEQVSQYIRLTEDKIFAELQRARYALNLSEQIVAQAEIALTTSIDTLSRYRFAFEIGKADLFYINALETKVNETELKLVDAQQNWFIALADMQAALGLNPLDQAVEISSLPESKRAAPGFLPKPPPLSPEKLQQDWRLHENAVPPGGLPPAGIPPNAP